MGQRLPIQRDSAHVLYHENMDVGLDLQSPQLQIEEHSNKLVRAHAEMNDKANVLPKIYGVLLSMSSRGGR